MQLASIACSQAALQLDVAENEKAREKAKLIVLPEVTKRSNKTLLLDLDGTLFCTLKSNTTTTANVDPASVHTISYKDFAFTNKVSLQVVVRPYAKELLRELSQVYEIVVRPACEKAGLHFGGERICLVVGATSGPRGQAHRPPSLPRQLRVGGTSTGEGPGADPEQRHPQHGHRR